MPPSIYPILYVKTQNIVKLKKAVISMTPVAWPKLKADFYSNRLQWQEIFWKSQRLSRSICCPCTHTVLGRRLLNLSDSGSIIHAPYLKNSQDVKMVAITSKRGAARVAVAVNGCYGENDLACPLSAWPSGKGGGSTGFP
jgi:hypothetical protein